jgi:hypothetical protein
MQGLLPHDLARQAAQLNALSREQGAGRVVTRDVVNTLGSGGVKRVLEHAGGLPLRAAGLVSRAVQQHISRSIDRER